MMTLPEIQNAVTRESAGQEITRANFAEIADRVPVTPARRSIDAEMVMRDAMAFESADWMDLCCFSVALRQAEIK